MLLPLLDFFSFSKHSPQVAQVSSWVLCYTAGAPPSSYSIFKAGLPLANRGGFLLPILQSMPPSYSHAFKLKTKTRLLPLLDICQSLPLVPDAFVRISKNRFFFGPDQGELAYPAHHMVLETTSRNQGSELSGAAMIAEMDVRMSTNQFKH
jgi:hypothetical protein